MDTTEDGSYVAPPLTQEEEDALIHLRIISDERGLRKLIKKFHAYVIAAEPVELSQKVKGDETSSEGARESLLAEIATFQMSLQKSALVCQAEARQVLEYEREKERIAQEHDVTRREIAKLKVTLEEEQMLRRRKIEYDQVAEKVNLLPTRAELQAGIDSIQEETLAIHEDNDHKARMMHARKIALDQIVSSLQVLRQMDKEPDIQIVNDLAGEGASGEAAVDEDIQREDREDRDDERRDRAREREARDQDEEGDESEGVPSTTLNPAAKPFLPKNALERLRDTEQGSPASSVPPSIVSSPAPFKPEEGEEGEEHEDIEMGEVPEQSPQTSAPTNGRPEQEELEEGEASDGEDPQAVAPPS
ncbi:hypothetical protein BU17DRAFT_84639 [Hysterangium stoloniferum]|nr:hypothetical protein BU17DRAFT_84639 [Hysterangium stoloniferum]